MYAQVEKSKANKSRSVASAVSKKNISGEPIFQFVDNRPEAIAKRKLHEIVNKSSQPHRLRAFQEILTDSANLPIQRFIGADGTNQEGNTIPFTLDQEFNDKHVAADVDGAIANTQARIDDENDLGGSMIREGNIGNTVATNEVWTAAIDGNNDTIPEEFYGPSEDDKAEDDFDPADYNDSAYSGNSSYMEIDGWNVKFEDDALVAEGITMERRVAGTYDVTNLDVSIDINHCTQ